MKLCRPAFFFRTIQILTLTIVTNNWSKIDHIGLYNLSKKKNPANKIKCVPGTELKSTLDDMFKNNIKIRGNLKRLWIFS